MSINLPPELDWVAKLAVGQSWPQGDEDKLLELGDAWNEAAQQLVTITASIDPATSGVLSNLGGTVADQFQSFVTQLQSNMPDMSDAAGQLGQLSRNTGVQVEYSKYMILAQLVWLAAEIVQLAFWAPEAVPAAITAARLVVMMILKRLLTSVAMGIGFMVGMDVAIQGIQMLKGDRTKWDVQDTISAVESGAISGAIGGIFSGVGDVVMPKFAGSLIGKGLIGGASGVVSTAAMDGIFGGEGDFGATLSSGILGAVIGGGGGRRRFGGGDDSDTDINVDLKLPPTPDLDLKLPGLDDITGKSFADDLSSDDDFSEHFGSGDVPTEGDHQQTTGAPQNEDDGTGQVRTTTPDVRTQTEGVTTPQSSPNEGFASGGQATRETTEPRTVTTATSPAPVEQQHVVTEPEQQVITEPQQRVTTEPEQRVGTGQQQTTGARGTPGGQRASGQQQSTGDATRSAAPVRSTSEPVVTRESTPAPVSAPVSTPAPVRTVTEGGGAPSEASAPTVVHEQQPVTTVTREEVAPQAPVQTSPGSNVGATSADRPPTQEVSTETPAPNTTTTTAAPNAPGAPVRTVSEPAPTTTRTDVGQGTAPVSHVTTESEPTTLFSNAHDGKSVTHGAVSVGKAAEPHVPPGPGSGDPRNTDVPANRLPPPPARLDRTPRFVVRSGFDLRRFSVNGQRFADLTVKVAFREGSGQADIDDTRARVQQGVKQFFNDPGYRLPNGEQLHVTVEHVAPDANPHLTVDLVGPGQPMDQRTWAVRAEPAAYAHEIAHQLGLRDEYRDETGPQRPHVQGSLLGDFREPPSEPGLLQGGLQGRHLDLLGALTGGDDHTVPGTGATAGGPGRDEAAPKAPGPKPQNPTTAPVDAPEGSHPSPANETVAEEPAPDTTRPWQDARQDATIVPRQHVWVDPVSDPTRRGPATESATDTSQVQHQPLVKGEGSGTTPAAHEPTPPLAEQIPARPPDRTDATTTEAPTVKAPAEAPVKEPVEAPVKAPVKAPAEVPVEEPAVTQERPQQTNDHQADDQQTKDQQQPPTLPAHTPAVDNRPSATDPSSADTRTPAEPKETGNQITTPLAEPPATVEHLPATTAVDVKGKGRAVDPPPTETTTEAVEPPGTPVTAPKPVKTDTDVVEPPKQSTSTPAPVKRTTATPQRTADGASGSTPRGQGQTTTDHPATTTDHPTTTTQHQTTPPVTHNTTTATRVVPNRRDVPIWTNHHLYDAAFAPRDPVPPQTVRRPPPRMTGDKQLGASDLLVSLHEDDSVVVERITNLFGRALGDDGAGKSIARSFFGASTVKPRLSALSRGDAWEAPFKAKGWSGKVTMRVSVEEHLYLTEAKKLEFEGGSEQQVVLGRTNDSRNRYIATLSSKFKTHEGDLTPQFSYTYDRMSGNNRSTGARTIARGKTTEPASLFGTGFRLTLDFSDVTRLGKPFTLPDGGRTHSMDIGGTVAVPKRDTLDWQGNGGRPDKLFAPPQRIVDTRRIGGSDIVVDVSATRHAPDGTPTTRGIDSVLADTDTEGQRVFGNLWPKVRNELGNIDLGEVHRVLKGMMSGEPVRIEVPGRTGSNTRAVVEITASVKSMQHWANTDSTEFNVGTGVVRSSNEQSTRSHLGTVPLPGPGNISKFLPGMLGGSGSEQRGRDRVQLSGDSQDVTVTTKLKTKGAVFDGQSTLHLNFKLLSGDNRTVREGHPTSDVDFTTIVEQSEAREVQPPPVGTVAQPAPDPTRFDARNPGPPGTRKVWPAGSTVAAPPHSVWGGPGPRTHPAGPHGLRDTVTTRDLGDVTTLHNQLDRYGRQQFPDEWDDIREEVMDTFSHPMVAGHLTSMTRGLSLETPALRAALLKHGIKVSATARVVEMEFKRQETKAELNAVAESGSSQANRTVFSRTRAGGIVGGGEADLNHPKAPDTDDHGAADAAGSAAEAHAPTPDQMDIEGAYGHQRRSRIGWRSGTAGRVYANGKYNQPQALFNSRVEVDVRFSRNNRNTDFSVPLDAEFSMDARDTVAHDMDAAGPAVFTRPAPTPVGAAGTHAPAPNARPRPTDQTADPTPVRTTAGPSNATPARDTTTGDATTQDPATRVPPQPTRPAPPVPTRPFAARTPPADLRNAPARIAGRGSMGASDVVHSLGPHDTKLVHDIEQTLVARMGRPLPDDLRQQLRQSLDPFALKGQLSRLTKGGKINVHVDAHGWKGTVTVRARLRGFNHTETVDSFEFELGNQYRTTTGISRDQRSRHTFGIPIKIKVPHVNISGSYTRTHDVSKSMTTDNAGTTASRGKTVEPAGLFTGAVDFRVDFDLKNGFTRFQDRPSMITLDDTTVAVPLREAPTGTGPQPLRRPPVAVPDRISSSWRLGSSDIVTDVFPVHSMGTGHTAVEATVDRIGGTGQRTLGGDWPGMRQKIIQAIEDDKLVPALKPLMSGGEIVLRHGRSEVRITSNVTRLRQTGETNQTEFNTGTGAQHAYTEAEDNEEGTKGNLGKANNITASVQGTSNPFPVGLAVVGGGGGSHAWGRDTSRVTAGGGSSVMTSKSKLEGVTTTGRARLVFTMTRDPLISLGSRERVVLEPTSQAFKDRFPNGRTGYSSDDPPPIPVRPADPNARPADPNARQADPNAHAPAPNPAPHVPAADPTAPAIAPNAAARPAVRPAPRTGGPSAFAHSVRSVINGDNSRVIRSIRRMTAPKRASAETEIGFDATLQASEARPLRPGEPQEFVARPNPQEQQAIDTFKAAQDARDTAAQASNAANGTPPAPTPVRIPPERVWTEGLRDIDVTRWIGDSSGIQDILRVRGPGFFGAKTWARLNDVASRATGHSQLSAGFNSGSRGDALSTPTAGHRLKVGDAQVSASVKLISLEYQASDSKVELSPTSDTNGLTRHTALDWSTWGGQGQLGFEGDVGAAQATVLGTVGMQHRGRNGTLLDQGGRVIASGKFNTPMARFNGHAEVTVTFTEGSRQIQEKGYIPVTIDIPERETGAGAVGDGQYLVFTRNDHNGVQVPVVRNPPPVRTATNAPTDTDVRPNPTVRPQTLGEQSRPTVQPPTRTPATTPDAPRPNATTVAPPPRPQRPAPEVPVAATETRPQPVQAPPPAVIRPTTTVTDQRPPQRAQQRPTVTRSLTTIPEDRSTDPQPQPLTVTRTPAVTTEQRPPEVTRPPVEAVGQQPPTVTRVPTETTGQQPPTVTHTPAVTAEQQRPPLVQQEPPAVTHAPVVSEGSGGSTELPHAATDNAVSTGPKAPERPPQPVSAADARSRYGMPKQNFTKFQRMARQRNLVIDVRQTNPHAAKWLEQGMLPKPADIKAKTIDILDTHLGANPEHLGLVGYFKPSMPGERPPGMDDGTWNSLQQRFSQRSDEFTGLAPKMQELADQNRFHVETGLVKGYNDQGRLTAIAGDHDVYDMTTPDGHSLTPRTYQETVDDMIANNMAVVHGAHTYWPEPRSPFSQGVYDKIIAAHAGPDGEPLVRFRPGQQNDAELGRPRPRIGPTTRQSVEAPAHTPAPPTITSRSSQQAPQPKPGPSRDAGHQGSLAGPSIVRDPATTTTVAPGSGSGSGGVERRVSQVVDFEGDSADLGDDQTAAVEAVATQVAIPRDSGRPTVVTVHSHAVVLQQGMTHFGRSMQLARQRGQSVADALDRALRRQLIDPQSEDIPLADLDSIVVSVVPHGSQGTQPGPGSQDAASSSRTVVQVDLPPSVPQERPPQPPPQPPRGD